MPPVRRTTQHTVGVDDELWDDCLLVAKARRETLSQVIRTALVDYRAAHLALLTEIKRAATDEDATSQAE